VLRAAGFRTLLNSSKHKAVKSNFGFRKKQIYLSFTVKSVYEERSQIVGSRIGGSEEYTVF
jgi:hypothetical protein